MATKTQEVRDAAIYVRVSTDLQHYSFEGQSSALKEYAMKNNIRIIKEFSDYGKSGLKLQGRPALQSLLNEVESKLSDYNIILVYDITRWGRYQDIDESAYYEYLCRKHGIKVIYIAEQFGPQNDPVSNIIKGIKRVMAGEFSRELSKKVFDGQCRIFRAGFRTGGRPGYGFRRLLLDQYGNTKMQLNHGEYKSVHTDRVVLIPGPTKEILIIKRIFQMFLEEGLSRAEIARRLNQQGILTETKQKWTLVKLNGILTNEKYSGYRVYNRTSTKLKTSPIANHPSAWLKEQTPFKSLIDLKSHARAKEIIRIKKQKLAKDQLREKLRCIYKTHGRITSSLIDEAPDTPSSNIYYRAFNSLSNAYREVGYEIDYSKRTQYIAQLMTLQPIIMRSIKHEIEKNSGQFEIISNRSFLINKMVRVSLVYCRLFTLPSGDRRWRIYASHNKLDDIAIIIRLNETGMQIYDYYIVPVIELKNVLPSLRENNNHLSLEKYRTHSLKYLFGLFEMVNIHDLVTKIS